MSAAHTPGPWTVDHLHGSPIVCHEETLIDVATVKTVGGYASQAEANALLMAAAPEMFQTLNDMDGWLANTGHAADHPWRLSIRAAIAKATGSAA